MREPGHTKDYERACYRDNLNRGIGIMQDFGEWECGPLWIAQNFANRALLYMEKGRIPPKCFDPNVKADQLEVVMSALVHYNHYLDPPSALPPQYVDVVEITPDVLVGISRKRINEWRMKSG